MRIRIFCLSVLLAALAGPVGAAPYRTPNTPNQPSEPVIQIVRLIGMGEAMANGRKHAYITVELVLGSGALRVYVPTANPNSSEPRADIFDKVNTFKPGDVFKLEVEKMNGITQIKAIHDLKLKPGEDSPHGYIYLDKSDEKGTVTLGKYGQEIEAALPRTRGEKGKMEPDPQVVAELGAVKEGDVVYASLTPGRVPQLASIYPYKEPASGKLVKVTEQEMEGSKAPAVEIEGSDGKTVMALVPGKLVNKRWVADANLVRMVKTLRPGTEVQYLTHEQDQKTFLIDISRAPAAAAPTASKEKKTGAQLKQ